MSTRALNRRLDSLSAGERPLRLIVQDVDPDGTQQPTDAELEAQAEALRNAGFTPHLVIVETVASPDHPNEL